MGVSEDEPEPRGHLGYLLRRAQQRHVALWMQIVSTETSSVQYAILAVLDRRGGTSQRELCDEVDLDRSTIADLVARMERRGLIERRRDPLDARRNLVTLTTRGREEHRRLHPLVDDVQAALAEGLNAEDAGALHSALRALLR